MLMVRVRNTKGRFRSTRLGRKSVRMNYRTVRKFLFPIVDGTKGREAG
jgi:hypothetical protein